MRLDTVGRGIRALRHRRGWRQQDLAQAAGVSRSVVSDLERGNVGAHALSALVRSAEALGASIRIDLVVPGGDVHRLLDADHASLQSAWMGLLAAAGWTVEAEVTFNHFGERGSIDILAWHPVTRALLVIEIKSVIVDIQELLAGIDRKLRIGRILAEQRGWAVGVSLPALVVAEGSTARRRLSEHAPLFARFALRGRAALRWLRDPASGTAPSGIVCLSKLPAARSGDRRRAGRQRLRACAGR